MDAWTFTRPCKPGWKHSSSNFLEHQHGKTFGADLIRNQISAVVFVTQELRQQLGDPGVDTFDAGSALRFFGIHNSRNPHYCEDLTQRRKKTNTLQSKSPGKCPKKRPFPGNLHFSF
jgi:hypothetical protein